MANAPTIPTGADLEETGAFAPPADAFVLLSKPALELTFDDMLTIANDLRAKRVRFLQGQQDRPDRKKLPEPTPEEREMRAEHVRGLIGNLKI